MQPLRFSDLREFWSLPHPASYKALFLARATAGVVLLAVAYRYDRFWAWLCRRRRA